jgi:hypothetical protein
MALSDAYFDVWDDIDSEIGYLRNEANRDAHNDPEFRCHDEEDEMPHPTQDALSLCNACDANTANPDDPAGYCDECREEIEPDPTLRRYVSPAGKTLAQIATTGLCIIATAAQLWATDGYAQATGPTTPPAGCTIVGDTGPDEGFPVAHCDDGSRRYLDMDGQPYANAAGAPVYCPGVVWKEMQS